MKPRRSLLLLIILWSLVSCTSNTFRKSYQVGFSAEVSHRFYVTHAVFDERLRAPVGSIGCCLGDAGAIVNGFSSLPQHLSIEWIDQKTHQKYFAHLDFPANLEKQLRELPGYILVKQNEERTPSPYLVISINKNNQAVSWLSNSRLGGTNIKQRVLIKLSEENGLPMPNH